MQLLAMLMLLIVDIGRTDGIWWEHFFPIEFIKVPTFREKRNSSGFVTYFSFL